MAPEPKLLATPAVRKSVSGRNCFAFLFFCAKSAVIGVNHKEKPNLKFEKFTQQWRFFLSKYKVRKAAKQVLVATCNLKHKISRLKIAYHEVLG